MGLTPQERRRLQEIEAHLAAEDQRLAKLLRTRPAGGRITLALQQLRTGTLAAILVLLLASGPVGLSVGRIWIGVIGYASAVAVGIPLLDRFGMWWQRRREMMRAAEAERSR